jgi:hypothetical protein
MFCGNHEKCLRGSHGHDPHIQPEKSKEFFKFLYLLNYQAKVQNSARFNFTLTMTFWPESQFVFHSPPNFDVAICSMVSTSPSAYTLWGEAAGS